MRATTYTITTIIAWKIWSVEASGRADRTRLARWRLSNLISIIKGFRIWMLLQNLIPYRITKNTNDSHHNLFQNTNSIGKGVGSSDPLTSRRLF